MRTAPIDRREFLAGAAALGAAWPLAGLTSRPRAASVNIGNGTIVALTPEYGVKSFLQEIDRKYPEEMLIRHNQRDKSRFDLFWVNVVTGVSEMVFENTEYADLFTDSHFQLRLA